VAIAQLLANPTPRRIVEMERLTRPVYEALDALGITY